MTWTRQAYPANVKLGGHTIPVHVQDEPLRIENDEIIIGSYHFEDKVIRLTHLDTSPTTAGENLVHEIIEAANHIYDMKLPHQTISTLAAGLFQALHSGGVNFGTGICTTTPSTS